MKTAYRYFLVLFVFGLAQHATAQNRPLMIFWDEAPACGRTSVPIEPGTIECSRTDDAGFKRMQTFKHGSLSISVAYSRFPDALRVVLIAENRSEDGVPVNVKMWNSTAFASFEAFEALAKPLFMSPPSKPLELVSLREVEALANRSRLPSNEPLTTQQTERRLFDPATGQIKMQTTTKIVPENPNQPIMIRGKVGASALKWTEVSAKTKQIGEMSFATEPRVKFNLVSFDIGGTTYIFKLYPLRHAS